MDRKEELRKLGFNIETFEVDVVGTVNERLITKSKTLTLALKEKYIPDMFFEDYNLAKRYTVDKVYEKECLH